MKYIRSISWFLGVSMFMVGFLKFFDPFKSWYSAQIVHSGLGDMAYALGIGGEMVVGIVLLTVLLRQHHTSPRIFTWVVIGSSALVVVMMGAGIYVHLHPSVPAEVLPLKIKPPYIPAGFMLLALLNAWLAWRQTSPISRRSSSSKVHWLER
jgi:uncharacterized membrane protein YjfL (UPF0719 family)